MVTAIPTSTSTVRARAEIRELTAAIGQNSLPRPPHPRPSRALSRLSIRPPLRLTYVTATVTRRHERSRSQLRQIHLDPIDFSVKSTRHLPLTSPLDTPLNATPHHSVDAVQRIRRISTDERDDSAINANCHARAQCERIRICPQALNATTRFDMTE